MEIIEDTDDLNHEQFEAYRAKKPQRKSVKKRNLPNTSDIIDEDKVEQPKEDLKEDPSSNQNLLETKLDI